MTVRVRFAPSPTGHLHIGGLRTALYNFLLAKSQGGSFILRIEDTDQERSEKKYEALQMEALRWAGIDWDEGPGEGPCGPYRQSERLSFYKKYADRLIEEDKAFYCFCTDEELAEMKEKAVKENRPPHYDGRYRNYPKSEALQRIAAGEKPAVRFKASLKSFILEDLVRGRVVFPENMVGDFVIVRSNGLPIYNFCCVVDDWLMKITHVVRGEDHLSNTVRQLMLYEALDASRPQFAHVSLLIGQDRQKLSKRHGVVSVDHYRQEGFLPEAMTNYLCLLGWSHPQEKEIFSQNEVVDLFDTTRFTKASAIYDLEKLKYINGQHLRRLSNEDILKRCEKFFPKNHPFFDGSNSWKIQCISFFKDQVQFFNQLPGLLDDLFRIDSRGDDEDELKAIRGLESTPVMATYLKSEIERLLSENKAFAQKDDFSHWMTHIKKELKIKGKPLFKGMRAVLTGAAQGPELVGLIPLTPLSVLKDRMKRY
ncbi:MAG: glutamate--tRNA ligase [Bacteriovoracales bacterium]|nr:glutamate--tRNA ligase [Bacteriovoracales bacterium]